MGNLNLGTHHDTSKSLLENNSASVSGSISKNINFGEINQNHALFGLSGSIDGDSNVIAAHIDEYSDPLHGSLSFAVINAPLIPRQNTFVAQFDTRFFFN